MDYNTAKYIKSINKQSSNKFKTNWNIISRKNGNLSIFNDEYQ